MLIFSPSPVATTSPTASADSSERLRAPAKPMSTMARSRTSIRRSPSGASRAVTISMMAASLAAGALPWVRRMPSHTIRTAGSVVGLACRAALWASEMAARRRRSIEIASTPAWSVR